MVRIGHSSEFTFCEKYQHFEILICSNLKWNLLTLFVRNRHSNNNVIWETKIHSIFKKQQFLLEQQSPEFQEVLVFPGSIRQGRGHGTEVRSDWMENWQQKTIRSYLYSIITLAEINFHEIFHSQWTGSFWQKTCQQNDVSKELHS